MMRPRTRAQRILLLIPIGIAAVLIVTFVGGQSVKLLWNYTVPPLFDLPAITFWQGLALLALCRILFGGLGLGGGSRAHYWRRWEAMTPEERERVRERMRQRMRERWGGPPTGESQAH